LIAAMSIQSFARWGVCLAFLFVCTGAFAQSLKLEQPAPQYAFDAAKPGFLHFKEVTVTRNTKYSLDFDFVLQEPLPNRLPKGEGVRYKVYFDLDGLVADYIEKKISPDFKSDLIISIFKNPDSTRFDSWVGLLQIRSTVHEIKITKLKVDADRISFSARCKLFGEVEGLRFAVSTGLLRGKGGVAKSDSGVQDSKVFSVPFKGEGLLEAEENAIKP
jgi:hypothetical protein